MSAPIPPGLSPTEALVLHALLSHAQPIAPGSRVHECSVPMRLLAASAGLSVSGFKVGLRDIERDGLVATEFRSDAGKPSVYRINVEQLKEFTPAMNRKKFDRLLASQNTVARKIFAAIPIAEAWPRHKIIAELERVGIACRHQVLDGVLANLAGCGLVKETSVGHFQQVTVREFERDEQSPIPEPEPERAPSVATVTTTQEEAMSHATTAPAPAAITRQPAQGCDPMSRLGNLASQLRQIADAIEEAALDAQQAVEAAGAESKKFQMLRAMLKEL